MELSLPHVNLNNNSPFPSKQPLILHHNNTYNTTSKIMLPRLRMGCLKEKSSLALKLESELEEIEEEGKEWKEMENCKGKKKQQSDGLVELLECLEKEAIMGNDDGREPFDYNRRARIFDKSSKVFQTLKEIHNQTEP